MNTFIVEVCGAPLSVEQFSMLLPLSYQDTTRTVLMSSYTDTLEMFNDLCHRYSHGGHRSKIFQQSLLFDVSIFIDRLRSRVVRLISEYPEMGQAMGIMLLAKSNFCGIPSDFMDCVSRQLSFMGNARLGIPSSSLTEVDQGSFDYFIGELRNRVYPCLLSTDPRDRDLYFASRCYEMDHLLRETRHPLDTKTLFGETESAVDIYRKNLAHGLVIVCQEWNGV